MEKITKWDAPFNPKTNPARQAIAEIEALLGSGPKQSGSRPSFWKRARKFPAKALEYFMENIDIVIYGVLTITNAITFFTLPDGKPHAVSAGALGFSAGMLWVSFFHKLTEASRKSHEEFMKQLDADHEQFKRRMWEIDTEARIRKEIETNYAP